MTPGAPPGFLRSLGLLWGLRLDVALNRRGARRPLIAALLFLLSSLPGVLLGLTFFALLRLPIVANDEIWPRFFLNLLCFVTSAVWCTWPLLSAGVDDHSELTRYAAFPVSPLRLLLASTLASLVEPKSIFFYAPVVGAALGYASTHAVPLVPAVALFLAFALLNAAWGRAALHVVLNVLRARRSAELIGGGMVVFLVAASFMPPVDTTWLTSAVQGGVEVLDTRFLRQATFALAQVPPGFFGHGLVLLHQGRLIGPSILLVLTLLFAAVGFGVAYALLLRFHRQVGRAGPALRESSGANPFARTGSLFATLVVREAVDLWHNPRARLLASVPFILAILLKLLSGRDLFAYFLGGAADAWLMGGLSLYGAVVIAATFAQNTFGYDGHGFAALLAAPLPLKDVLRAKNIVHAAAAGLLSLLVVGFYRVYFGAGALADMACALLGVVALVPVLLLGGNLLSQLFPVKFHANLKRRDKLPFAASMLGVLTASAGCLPFGIAVRLEGASGPGLWALGFLVLASAVTWTLYLLSLRPTMRMLETRKERVLRAVTRE